MSDGCGLLLLEREDSKIDDVCVAASDERGRLSDRKLLSGGFSLSLLKRSYKNTRLSKE